MKGVLPKAALKIWVSTYNAVYDETGGDEDEARQAAWSNVKKAGYKRGDDGKWHRASAEIEENASLLSTLRVVDMDRASAMALPNPTPTKVYAEFKLLTFNKANKNKDGFLAQDITEEIVDTLIGSPIYLDEAAIDHPEKEERATRRAPYQVGTIIRAEKREDGIYCMGSFQREFLEDRGFNPHDLDKHFSTSMETIFDRSKSKYQVGDRLLSYKDALAEGVAAPFGKQDDRSKYDARYMVPMEFHAAALLLRGRNADPNADVLRVAAAEEDEMEEVLWSADDVESFLAHAAVDPDETSAAELSTEERKKLRKSQFAYIDEKGEGHLPIHDAAHVKNALARLNQTDISASAKRKALKKILAAAKRFGIKPDMKSKVMKLYSAEESLEEGLREIHDAFYTEFEKNKPSTMYCYIIKTYGDYLIYSQGDTLYKVGYKRKDSEIEFGDPVEVEIRYEPVKGGSAMSDAANAKTPETPEQQPKTYTAEEFDKAVKEVAEAKAKELAAKMVEDERPKIAEKAVAEYVAREKLVTERMKELGDILEVAEDEKVGLEEQIRKIDDAGYYKLVAERSKAALQKAREERAAASTATAVPTLRAEGGTLLRDPYAVTVK